MIFFFFAQSKDIKYTHLPRHEHMTEPASSHCLEQRAVTNSKALMCSERVESIRQSVRGGHGREQLNPKLVSMLVSRIDNGRVFGECVL